MKFSIRYKFAIGFLFIFCISFNCITLFINNMVIKNNEKVISDEFKVFQRDVDIYLNQYLIINNTNFEDNYEKIGLALSSKVNSRVMIYSNIGEIKYDSDYNNGNLYLEDGTPIQDDLIDLNKAINEEAAYKIININGLYKVFFSKPLYIKGEMKGILRYSKDYTELFKNGESLILKIRMLMIIVFAIVFIFSFSLATSIIIPIIKLNKVTKEIAKGNFDFNVSIKSNDEIGELSESFNIMKEKIKEQIDTIKKDRDDLIRSESHRKTFYDNVTHEIKTPLTIIDGYAQMILDEGILDEELILKAAGKIKNESNKLRDMVVDILNISKLESKSNNDLAEKISMKNCIEDICSQISVKANKYDIKINKYLEDEVYVYANLNDINSMLVNIIDNSIKYSNVKSQININMFKNDNNCIIIFEDQGIGIREEALKKIFEPFYRGGSPLENRKNGNGLGLSIVKSIVDKYNGEIKIESEINTGTRVFISIPLV